jgi:hypothetical protein
VVRLGLLHTFVDGGLEALEVDDEVGVAQASGLLGAEFQVVRFTTGLGEGFGRYCRG